MKPLKPLDLRFFAAAIASGALTPPDLQRPEIVLRRMSVRRKLFYLMLLVLLCIGGLAYGILAH